MKFKGLGIISLLLLSLVASLFAILPVAPAHAATPAPSQTATNTSSSSVTSISCTLSSSISAGSAIIVGVVVNAGISAFSDSAGNSWTSGPAVTNTGTGFTLYTKYTLNAVASSSDTITASFSAADPSSIVCIVVSLSSLIFDTSSTGTGSGTTLSVTSYTPTTNDFIIAFGAVYSSSTVTWTAGSGYTLSATTTSVYRPIASEYLIASSGATTSPLSVNPSSPFAEVSLAFKWQIPVSLTFNPAPNATPLSASNYFVVSYRSAGNPATANCFSTCSFNADPSTTVTIPATSSGSTPNEKWCLQLQGGSCSSVSFSTGASGSISQTYVYYDLLYQAFLVRENSGSSGVSYVYHFTTAPSTASSTYSPLFSSIAFLSSQTGAALVLRGSTIYPEAYNYHSTINTATQQYSASPLTYGLVGYWPFDEATSGTCTGSVYDLSHYNNTGTCNNSPTWVSGKLGGALQFNGVNQYVFTSANPLGSSQVYTLTAWIYVIGFPPAGSSAPIVSTINGFSGNGLYVATDGTTGFHYWIWEVGAGSPNQYFGVNTDGVLSVQPNTWYFVVGQVNNGQFSLNVNAQTFSGTYSGTVNNGTPGPVFAWQNGLSTYFNGIIDDVRIYNRALSASEIQELYASTVPVLEQTATTAGATLTTNFYSQGKFTVTQSGSTASYATVSFTSLGQSLSITPSSSTNTFWGDISTNWSANPGSCGSGCRIMLTGGSGTVSAGASFTFTATQQFALVYSYSLIGGGTFQAPSVSCTYLGASNSTIMQTTPQNFWCDYNTAWSITNPLGGSTTTQRAQTNQVTSGTVTGTVTTVFSYYNQFATLISYTISPSCTAQIPTFKGQSFGAPLTQSLSSTPATVWLDASSPWSVPSPFICNLQQYVTSPRAGLASTGTVTGPLVLSWSYVSAPRCSNINPISNLESGCMNAVIQAYTAITGTEMFWGFIFFIIDVAALIKSQDVWYPILLMVLEGAVMSAGSSFSLLPQSFQMFGYIFFAGAIALSIGRLVWSRL